MTWAPKPADAAGRTAVDATAARIRALLSRPALDTDVIVHEGGRRLTEVTVEN